MKKPPKQMLPLIAMGSSDDVSPEQFRDALGMHDKDQLRNNGFHLIQSLGNNSDLAVTSMKFACVHQALGSDAGTILAPMSSQMLGKDGKFHHLSDQQACRFVQYVLDDLAIKAFPGLIYMACYFDWPECAKFLRDRGVYAPLDWTGFSATTDDDRFRWADMLLKIVRPSMDDMRIIRRAFKDGEPAALIFDRAMANQCAPVAVQINLFPKDEGLLVVPFSSYDATTETATEVGRFVIPWHELHDIIDRMELIEKGKLNVDIGAKPF